MLRNFRRYLIQEKLDDEINERNKRKHKPLRFECCSSSGSPTIKRFLQIPIHDHRKYCLWRILAPYFANVRKFSDEESYVGIMSWLERCNKVKKLSFNPRYRIRYEIRNAKKIGYLPISWEDLKLESMGHIYEYETLNQQSRQE